jgi:uncharacterized protein (DUF1015 family)
MAQFFPFSALRPTPDKVITVSCPPYDVLTTKQAKELSDHNPDSLLHVTLPEVDGEASLDELRDRGSKALSALASRSDVMTHDDQPYFYLYEQGSEMGSRTGIFGTVHSDDYHSGKIIRHELTRPDKVEERTQHIIAQQAHAEPVMLAYQNTPALKACIRAALIDAIPLYDFTDEQHVRHRVFRAHPDSIKPIQSAFSEQLLYIADGHHRCEAAYQASERISISEPSKLEEAKRFPAVLIPHDELVILSYNRYVKQVTDTRWSELSQILNLVPSDSHPPAHAGLIKVGHGKQWYLGILPPISDSSEVGRIDAQRLHEAVLEPLYGIKDVRTDHRIGFSGGSESIDTLKKGLESGSMDIAFVLHPVNIEDLFQVSDAGLLMPPKSTWFEPKLRSGILIHTF